MEGLMEKLRVMRARISRCSEVCVCACVCVCVWVCVHVCCVRNFYSAQKLTREYLLQCKCNSQI